MGWPLALQSLDESVLRVALSTPAPLVTAFFIVTTVGGGWGLLAVLPFALRRSTRAATLWLFAAVTLTSGAVSLIKFGVGRVRPCDALPWCAALSGGSPGGPSFPSGHAAGSFAFAAFVAVRAPRFAPLAFFFAALVAWSRCVLGVHYPTDILTGALVGALIGATCARRSIRSLQGLGSTSPRPPGDSPQASAGEPPGSSR